MGQTKKSLKWISVTGLDGSGKTSLVTDLCNWLTECKKKVKKDRLPHDEYIVKTLLDKSTDSYTDRMLFALDNRLFAEEVKKIKDVDYLVTQRCFLDSFVHGAVQGFSYEYIEQLNKTSELPRVDYMIHLVADAKIAYKRIKDDPDADKFEYLSYIQEQERQTRNAFYELENLNPNLETFFGCKNYLIDTTSLSIEATFEIAKKWLSKELNIK